MELAEERALHDDPETCSAARAMLTNPRKRLSAEVAWLPGLSPQKAASARTLVAHDPAKVVALPGLSGLARVNVIAEALPALADRGREALAPAAIAICDVFEAIDTAALRREINEDRGAAGFPTVQDETHLDEALAEHRHFLAQLLIDTVDRLPTDDCIEIAEKLLSNRQWDADELVPALLEDFVSAYELRTKSFLESEADAIEELLDAIRELAEDDNASAHAAVAKLVDRAIAVLSQWDRVAQPIQLLRRHQGIDHVASVSLAGAIRSTAIYIANEHDYYDQAQRLTKSLETYFAEVPELVEQLGTDLETLEGLIGGRERRAAAIEERKRELTYETTFGLVFQDRFRMSPEAIEWKSQRWPLDEIKGIRWIGIRSQSGLTFVIEFSDGTRAARLDMNDEKQFDAITSRLMRSVGMRIFGEMMEALSDGRAWAFGEARVADRVVELPSPANQQRVQVRWSDVRKSIDNGAIHLVQESSPKARAVIELGQVWNAVVLNVALNVFWKRGGDRLSSIVE